MSPERPGRHFRYIEFVGGGGCARFSERQLLAIHDLCWRFLDPLRDEFGRCTVHSGCRSLAHNRRVGGAPGSFHLYGSHPGAAAADVSCARGSPADWYGFLDRLGAGGLGRYAGHVHVDNRRVHARW